MNKIFKIVSEKELFNVELTIDNFHLVANKISKNAYMRDQLVCMEFSIENATKLRDFLNEVLK